MRTNDYGPLAGAKITTFKKISDSNYSLRYELNKKQHRIDYSWNEDGLYQFLFFDENGDQSTEIYEKSNDESLIISGAKEKTKKKKKPKK